MESVSLISRFLHYVPNFLTNILLDFPIAYQIYCLHFSPFTTNFAKQPCYSSQMVRALVPFDCMNQGIFGSYYLNLKAKVTTIAKCTVFEDRVDSKRPSRAFSSSRNGTQVVSPVQ